MKEQSRTLVLELLTWLHWRLGLLCRWVNSSISSEKRAAIFLLGDWISLITYRNRSQSLWTWKQNVSPKRLELRTQRHVVTTQHTWIFKTVHSGGILFPSLLWCWSVIFELTEKKNSSIIKYSLFGTFFFLNANAVVLPCTVTGSSSTWPMW